MPTFSIVTPCLNAEAFIAEAVQSVISQGRDDIEHIVVDGGSTDGTLAVLSRYAHLRIIRQRDNGLYEALNHGVDAARGVLIGHLNADDCYINRAFDRVIDAYWAHPDADMISGTALVGRSGVDMPGAGELIANGGLNIDAITNGVPAINARFMKRSLYGRVGLYETGYRRAADREFLIRATLAGAENTSIPNPLYWYRSHAGSLTIGGNRRGYLSVGREHMDIARRYLGDERLSVSDRALLRRWHSEGATLEVADALLSGQIGRLTTTLGRALSADALAIPRLFRFGVAKLARMLLTDRRRGS